MLHFELTAMNLSDTLHTPADEALLAASAQGSAATLARQRDALVRCIAGTRPCKMVEGDSVRPKSGMNALGHRDSHKAQVPLHQAVASWQTQDLQETAQAQWSPYAAEPGATCFAQFLCKLKDARAALEMQAHTPWTHAVLDLLGSMLHDPALRAQCFDISMTAAMHREDRVTEFFHAMETTKLAHSLNSIDSVPELIKRIRQLFRREALLKISLAHSVAPDARRFAVRLQQGYQVRLNTSLNLGLTPTDMACYDHTWISDSDLAQVRGLLLDMEQEGFLAYLLNESAAWELAFERLDPARYRAMKAAMSKAFWGDASCEFKQRMAAAFQAELGGTMDSGIRVNAERILGPIVSAELSLEVQLPFVAGFLASQGLDIAELLPQRSEAAGKAHFCSSTLA